MRKIGNCPLLLSIAAAGLFLSLFGACNRKGLYRDYQEKTAGKPGVAAVMLGIKDGIYPWDLRAGKREDTIAAMADGREQPPAAERVEKEVPAVSGNALLPEAISQNTLSQNGISENGVLDVEEPETYEFVQVGEDYFSDALFIGDSRTQGMLEYGGLEEKATFYCRTSLTIYDLFQKEKAFISAEGENLTLTQALERRQFGKIYLMIGINEMGTGTAESFFLEYARAVYRIRELQPDAIVFLQGIMRVGAEKNASDPLFNNTNINLRNAMIETLADGQNLFYVDVNEAVCGQDGNLYGDWTFDQIHLKAKYYQVWKDYLMAHGIVKP